MQQDYSGGTGEAVLRVPVLCGPRRWPVARRPFDSWDSFWKVTVINALNGVRPYLATQNPPSPPFSPFLRAVNWLLCVKDNIYHCGCLQSGDYRGLLQTMAYLL